MLSATPRRLSCTSPANRAPRLRRYGNPTVRAADRKWPPGSAEAAALFASGMAAPPPAPRAAQGRRITCPHATATAGRPSSSPRFLSRSASSRRWWSPRRACLAGRPAPGRPRSPRRVPTNPYLRVADLCCSPGPGMPARSDLIIDVTSPPRQPAPAPPRVDLVIHSARILAATTLLGRVCGRAGLVQRSRTFAACQAACSIESAFLLIRGLKTLPLRVQARTNRACRGAARAHRGDRVFYPGCRAIESRERAQQMRGFGRVVSFRVRGDARATSRVITRCRLATIGAVAGGRGGGKDPDRATR